MSKSNETSINEKEFKDSEPIEGEPGVTLEDLVAGKPLYKPDIEPIYDDGQGRRYDIIDEELE